MYEYEQDFRRYVIKIIICFISVSNQEIETEETIMDEKLEKIYQEANATLNQMVQNSGELATGDQQPSVMNKVLRWWRRRRRRIEGAGLLQNVSLWGRMKQKITNQWKYWKPIKYSQRNPYNL